jgi:hypothetical protein
MCQSLAIKSPSNQAHTPPIIGNQVSQQSSTDSLTPAGQDLRGANQRSVDQDSPGRHRISVRLGRHDVHVILHQILCSARDPLWLGGSDTNFSSGRGSSINICHSKSRTKEQLELRINRSIATPYQTSRRYMQAQNLY